jgi:hypothetical protein
MMITQASKTTATAATTMTATMTRATAPIATANMTAFGIFRGIAEKYMYENLAHSSYGRSVYSLFERYAGTARRYDRTVVSASDARWLANTVWTLLNPSTNNWDRVEAEKRFEELLRIPARCSYTTSLCCLDRIKL